MAKPSDDDILKVMYKTKFYFMADEIADRFNSSTNNYDDYVEARLRKLKELGYVTDQPTRTEKGLYTGYIITKAGIEYIKGKTK